MIPQLISAVRSAGAFLSDRLGRRPANDAALVLAQTHWFYIALDQDGTVRSWNRAAADLFGFPAVRALGRRVDDLIIPPAQHAAHRSGMEHYLRTGRGRDIGIGSSVEVEALCADGSLIPIELTIWAHPGPAGTRFHALGHDLSLRRQRDEALALLAEHRQALLLTDSPVGVRDLLCRTVRRASSSQGVYLYEPDGRDTGGLRLRLTAESVTLGDRGQSQARLGDDLLGSLDGPEGTEVRVTRDQLTDEDGADALRATGLQTFVIRPLLRRGELIGVLLLG